MSDDLVKALLESLTPEQKSNLIDQLLSSNAKSDASETREDVAPPEPQSNISEDFKVIKQNDLITKNAFNYRITDNWITINDDLQETLKTNGKVNDVVYSQFAEKVSVQVIDKIDNNDDENMPSLSFGPETISSI